MSGKFGVSFEVHLDDIVEYAYYQYTNDIYIYIYIYNTKNMLFPPKNIISCNDPHSLASSNEWETKAVFYKPRQRIKYSSNLPSACGEKLLR